MRDLTMFLNEIQYARDLKKLSEKEGFSILYPNVPKEKLQAKLEDLEKEEKKALEEYNECYRKRKQLEDIAYEALQKYRKDHAEGSRSGNDYAEKKLENYLTPEYNELEGASSIAQERIVRIRGDIVRVKNEIENNKEYHFRNRDDYIKDFLKEDLKPLIVGVLFGLVVVRILIVLIKYISGVMNLNPVMVGESGFWFVLFGLMPVALWLWSTCYKEWCYYDRKFINVGIVLVSALMSFLLVGTKWFMEQTYGYILKIPTTSVITPEKIVVLARVLTFICSAVPVILLFSVMIGFLQRPEVVAEIKYYKFMRGKDFRRDKQFKYDIPILKDMKSGALKVIKEADMFLHMIIVGATGTGKTSSVLLPIIKAILDKIVYNMDYQILKVREMCKNGKVRVKREFENRDFDIKNFEPAEELTEEEKQKVQLDLEKLNTKAPVGGIIMACPNEDMADQGYEMTKNRCLKVYRVDPIRTASGHAKEDRIGLNPLYISPMLDGMKRYDAIVTISTIVMDIMSSMSEETGSVDAYFDSVNRIQTVVTCKLLLLTYESLYKKQPTLKEVQDCLSDYTRMRPFLIQLVRLYGKNGAPMELMDGIEQKSQAQINNYFASLKIDCGLWQDVYTIIVNELLDEKLGGLAFERANGLRNQLNIFLNTPRVNELICTTDTIDIDAVLRDGGVVIFNYAIELGTSASRALGEFFIMIYTQAVLRRPRHEFCRPFFFLVDELPTLLNKSMIPLWTLARQYNCSTIAAIQNLAQFNQKRSTEFMRDTVLSSSGQRIFFGNLSPDEADYVEKLGGKKKEYMNQDTVSQTSISNPNPNYSYSTRTTPQDTPYVSADDAAWRDFQEVTAILREDNSPCRPLHARVEFLRSSEWLGAPRPNIDWSEFYDMKTLSFAEEEMLQVKEQPKKKDSAKDENTEDTAAYEDDEDAIGGDNPFAIIHRHTIDRITESQKDIDDEPYPEETEDDETSSKNDLEDEAAAKGEAEDTAAEEPAAEEMLFGSGKPQTEDDVAEDGEDFAFSSGKPQEKKNSAPLKEERKANDFEISLFDF